MPNKSHLDFETYSEVDLRRAGVFRYAAHPSTEVLIISWDLGDGEIHHWTIGQPIAKLAALFAAVRSGRIMCAHNAQFEHTVWNRVLRRQLGTVVPEMRFEQMNCTAARAAMCGLPRALERAADALQLPIRKDKRGTELMRIFSKPRKPTKSDPRTRILPADAPEKFAEFIEYCDTDVATERELDKHVPELPEFEQRVFALDMKINSRGLPIDIPLVRKASAIVTELAARNKKRANKITRGINPTQRDKLLKWLVGHGVEVANLQAKTIAALMKDEALQLSDDVRELLELRVEAAKASVKKLEAMLRVVTPDGYARGCILYYGAHTGRWSGKLIQPHNYIRGLLKLAQQAVVFALLQNGDADLFEALYDKPLYAIAQVMRGFIAAKAGNVLRIVDYSQIEARLLVWLAQEHRAIREYEQGLDRYKVMAAFLFGIKIEEVSDEQRRIAKNLVLGCGFGLGWRKFIEYCAKEDLIIDADMSKRAVGGFREYHPAVVKYWGDVERCAKAAIRRPGTTVTLRNVQFAMYKHWLTIKLPSGRRLYYPYARIDMVERAPRWEGDTDLVAEQITYRTEYFSKWIRTSTYGGKLVENIVQATARDVMFDGMERCEEHNYPIVGTVHDELIAEQKKHHGSIKHMEALIAQAPTWAPGFPIAAKGFEAERYRKG